MSSQAPRDMVCLWDYHQGLRTCEAPQEGGWARLQSGTLRSRKATREAIFESLVLRLLELIV
eukprot:4824674-Prymnesium_polylepis.1